MTEHVEHVVRPVRERAAGHDDWHLKLLQAQAGRLNANVWSAISTIVAGAAVVVAIFRH
jgi:hypothetical protein